MKDSNGKLVDTPFCHQLYRMFETQRETRRKKLRLPAKQAEKAGKTKGKLTKVMFDNYVPQ